MSYHYLTDYANSFIEKIENSIETACIDDVFLLDEHFSEKRDCAKWLYAVCIKDTNTEKNKLFTQVDIYGDKIVHITPKTYNVFMFENEYQVYIYVKADYANQLFASYKIPNIEILHSIKFRDYFTIGRFLKTGVIYCKTDYVYNEFRHWLQYNSVKQKLPTKNKKFILITGNSDFEINNELVNSYLNDIEYWFGTNITSTHNHCIGIPLGLTSYDTRETCSSFLFRYGDTSEYHQLLANDSCLIDSWNLPKLNNWKTYMNFSCGTYHDRPRIWNEFKNVSWIYAKEHKCTSLYERKCFFEDLRQAEFSLCPRGNGIDTHRFWESLYSGTIPIIEKNRVYEHFKGLPYIEFNKIDTNTITVNEIDSKKTLLTHEGYNYHKLYVSYWIEQMERKSVLLTEY